MLASSTFGLSDTSEKTLEINVLNEFSAYIWYHYGMKVTLIAPTQPEENNVGFDEIVEGLPSGQILVIQFKRPYELIRPADCVRFHVDTLQLNRLANNFQRCEAYLFLTPLPKNYQIVSYRRALLTKTVAFDVYDIPRYDKITQKTRTIRVHTHRTLTGVPLVEIADPRVFQSIGNVTTAARIADLVSQGEIGYKLTNDRPTSDRLRDTGIGVRKLYYLHVSEEKNFREPNLET